MNNPINIIYFTHDCNFRCSYCYEHQGENVSRSYMSKSDIKRAVDNIVENSHPMTEQIIICMFGGEPFLNFEGMNHFMEYIRKYASRFPKGIATDVITNGSLLHHHIDAMKKWTCEPEKNIFFSFFVSYDGRFQYRRTSSDIVEKNMLLLKEAGVPFGISYTISTENYRKEDYLKDIVEIYYKFLCPVTDRGHQQFRINIDYSNIEKCLRKEKKTLNEYMSELEDSCLYIYSKFRFPICQLACKFCKKCNFEHDSRRYYTSDNDTMIESTETQHKFNHFK